MTGRKVIAAEFWLMVLIQTIGGVDIPKPGKPNSGKRKLPAPRYYAAACILFALLGLFAEMGPRQAKVASGIGGTAVLAALVVGVAGPGHPKEGTSTGQRVLGFINRVANLFAPRRPQPPAEQEPEGPESEEV